VKANLKPQDDRFVNSGDAAKILATTPNTLNYWRMVGRGPKYYRQGRNIRYLVSDLMAWGTAESVDPTELKVLRTNSKPSR
jgi:hypothetical protein